MIVISRPMINRMAHFLLALTLCILSFKSISAVLPEKIRVAISESALPINGVSVWVAPVNGEAPIIEWQTDTLRAPASTMKVITTGVGLALLGGDFRWKTLIYTNGELKNGILTGDLIIKGQGNPYFVQEDMAIIVAELRRLGLSRINGKIILDSSYFISSKEEAGAFDGHGIEPYNAIPHALSINFRTLSLVFDTTKTGVNVGVDVPLAYTRIQNDMVLNNLKRCRGKGFSPRIMIDSAQDLIIVSGQMSKKCSQRKLTKVLTGAGDLFYAHFKKAWLESGGELSRKWIYGNVTKESKLFYTHYSQPLAEQIKAMNKFSNNIMTRQLFLTLGAEKIQAPATLVKSRAVVKNFLNEIGIKSNNIFIDNGSGLSRLSSITARQLGHFLLAINRNNRIREDFKGSLSIAGVDGTLRKRLRNTPLKGNAIGKTGTLKHTKSLVGYLTAQSGKQYAYVMLFEGKRARAGSALMDTILQWVYSQ